MASSSPLVKIYLILYNLASALGWAYVLHLAVMALLEGKTPAEFWAIAGTALTIVQTAAFMEIVHSLIGLVSSPVGTVFLQVNSRLILVWLYSRPYTVCQEHWSLYLMVVSWSLVEVPRYLFYVFAQLPGNIPYPLFYLRYSLFMVLYPSGIIGEMLQMYASLSYTAVNHPLTYRLTIVVLSVVYPLGGPFMVLNMWGNRVRAFKKRATDALPPRPLNGLVWPITSDKTQERSTSITNKVIFSQAVGAVDKVAQEKLDQTRDWRFGYARHVENSLKVSLASPEKALGMARAGLSAARREFRFIRDGKETSFEEALSTIKGSFSTGEIKGTGPKGSAVLDVPYGGKDPRQPYYLFKDNNDVLSNGELKAQLDKWVQWGTIEASAADAIKSVIDNQNKWLDLSDKYFVLLGATSAMGPLDMLLKYGANIIAVDLDRDFIWTKLISKARASCGRIIFPIQDSKAKGRKQSEMTDEELAKVSGANLLEHTPEIANWIETVCPGKPLFIGNYTYLDGALHVQLSIACDAIIERLCSKRKDTQVGFLCTPTDVHVIPEAANKAASENFEKSPWWMKLISSLPGKRLVKNALAPVTPDNGGSPFYYVDGLSIAQGPNYALAKRLQHWRAILARSEGHTVASNIAPSTATKSVVSAAMFAAAYGGFHLFKPLEVMYQETSNAVMFAIMLHDILNPKSKGNPSFALANPYQLFEYGSFHGGVWRSGYKLDTIGEVAVFAYFGRKYSIQGTSALAALTAVTYWVVTGRISPF